MRSRYEAFLNDIALSSISADLQVLDISYAVPSIKNVTYTVAKRDGQRVARRYTDQATVTITFELHIYDTVKRQAACQNVAAWAAKGGVLRTSDRMGQQLTCICTTMPTITSAMRWNDAIAVTFTAFPLSILAGDHAEHAVAHWHDRRRNAVCRWKRRERICRSADHRKRSIVNHRADRRRAHADALWAVYTAGRCYQALLRCRWYPTHYIWQCIPAEQAHRRGRSHSQMRRV